MISLIKEPVIFSIIVPAYNASRYIEKTLVSVFQQTFRSYELIVVDDGSSDSTVSIVETIFGRFQQFECHLVKNVHQGIAATRNSGIRMARGEWVAFLDADDLWYPEKLRHIYEYLCVHPKCRWICHDEVCVSADGQRRVNRYGPRAGYEQLLFEGNCLSTSATAVRRTCLSEVGYFAENMDFNGVEDYELWLRLSRTVKAEFLPEILGEYFVHGGGISSSIENQTTHTLNVITHHFTESFPNGGLETRIRFERHKAKILRGAGFQLFRKWRFSDACQKLRLSLDAEFEAKTWVVFLLSWLFLLLRLERKDEPRF